MIGKIFSGIIGGLIVSLLGTMVVVFGVGVGVEGGQ